MTDTATVGVAITGIQIQTGVIDGVLMGDVVVTYGTRAGGNVALFLGSLQEPLTPAFLDQPALQAFNTLLLALYSLWEKESSQS